MRDEFIPEVKRTLAARVGYVCSNPTCHAVTSGPQDDPAMSVNVGVAAHITAASPGGARYAHHLSPEARSHPDNGIWLCQNCGKLVDNDPVQFPEEVLRAWKTLAEHRARSAVGKTAPAPAETEAQRKVRAILQWKGKTVTLAHMNTGHAVMMLGPVRGTSWVQVFDCTEFVVTVGTTGPDASRRSIPLANIDISYDDAHSRLELQERYL
jgi:hypothetical protein